MKFSRKSLTIMALLLVIVSVTALFAGCKSENPTTASTPLVPSTTPEQPTDPTTAPTKPTETEPTVEPTKPTETEPTVEPTKPEEEDVWGVCGSFTNWGVNGEADYILVPDSEWGLATKGMLNLKAGDEFKVRLNGAWDVAYPEENFVVNQDGQFFITFDPETHKVTIVGYGDPTAVRATFTEEQKGTYIRNNGEQTMTINDDGTVDLNGAYNVEKADVLIWSNNDTEYSFDCSMGEQGVMSINFRFVNGMIVFTNVQDGWFLLKQSEVHFTTEQVGTFANMEYSLTIHENGTVSYADATQELPVSEFEGKYYFLHEVEGKLIAACFSFNDDGSVTLEDTINIDGTAATSVVLSVNGVEIPPEIEPVEFTDAQKGTYICKNDAWSMDCTLIIHDDSTLSLTDSLQPWSTLSHVSVTMDEEGYYCFDYFYGCESSPVPARFRFVNGLIYLYVANGDFYMIKPTEGLGFSGDQVGTFVGKDDAGDVDYSLTVNENGTVSYAYSIRVSGYDFTISASDEDLSVSEFEGKYYFLYEDAQSGAVLAAFRFNDDGSVSLEDTFDEEGEPLNTATLQVAEEEVVWGVCGSFTNWGLNGEADYILVLDPETGLLTTEEALELNAGDEFKVRKNGVWGEEYPAQNYVVEKGGKYFITFNAETHEVALVAVEEPAAGFTAEQIGKYETNAWNAADKRTIVVKENGTISYMGSEELTVTYENGAYHFTYNGIAYSFTFTTQLSETGYLNVGVVLDISNEPDLEADADKTVTIWKIRAAA